MYVCVCIKWTELKWTELELWTRVVVRRDCLHCKAVFTADELNWTDCNKSTQLHGASRRVHWSLIWESYTVIICQQSYLLIWYSITHSLFHSRLKTSLFCKSFPPQPFLFLFQDSPHDSPDCLLLFISISIFYVLVVLFLRILVVGSVR